MSMNELAASISMDSRTNLLVLERNLNGHTYAYLLHRVPFIERTFRNVKNCILQNDNAPSHRPTVVTEKKQELDFRITRWPSRSSDMNTIEHA